MSRTQKASLVELVVFGVLGLVLMVVLGPAMGLGATVAATFVYGTVRVLGKFGQVRAAAGQAARKMGEAP